MSFFDVYRAIHDDDIYKLRKLMTGPVDLTWSPLNAAILMNRTALVPVLLSHPDIDANFRSTKGFQNLLVVCDLPIVDLNIARYILAHGADPNSPNGSVVGPLHLACKHNSLELVKLLIQHHANVNSQDGNGYTPLHYAVGINSPEIIEYLLANNADANLTETHGLNAIMFTVQFLYCRTELLIPHTENLNAVSADGCTALIYAIQESNVDATWALLEHGASLTAHTCNCAPLQLAVTSGMYPLIELIWQYTDLATVSQDPGFMWLFCTHCPLPYCYKHFALILNTRGVDLHLNGATGYFYKIFQKPPVNENFETAKTIYLNVIHWLLNKNVQLRRDDVEHLLSYFKESKYTRELWQMIFAKTTPDITEHIVTQAIDNQNYDLAQLFITYCLHLNPENVINFEHELNESFLRNWLTLFTPTSRYRRIITYQPVFAASDSATKILNEMKPVKSLLELSRDGVREAMRVSCKTTLDFLAALEQLEVPTHLKDVVRLQIPVNQYLLEE